MACGPTASPEAGSAAGCWCRTCSPACRSRCWSVSMVEFAVWAPRPQMVRLDVDGTLYPMDRSDDGWWRTHVPDSAVRPDARYGFALDDDPTVLPDPRSPRQPEGVHERSQLWRPAVDA